MENSLGNRLADDFATKFKNLQNTLIYETRNCDSLRTDLSRIKKEHDSVLQQTGSLRGREERLVSSHQKARDRVAALEEEATSELESLSQLREAKISLKQKLAVASSEREQLQVGVTVTSEQVGKLESSAKQLAAKIEATHRERLQFKAAAERHKAAGEGAAAELEALSRKLQGLKQTAYSSLAASGVLMTKSFNH